MAYTRSSSRKQAIAARRGVVNGGTKNVASSFVSAADKEGAFNPSYSLGEVSEVTSKDFNVLYEQAGNSMGEPQKIATFGGKNAYGLTQQSEDAKFVGLCNKGNSTLEIMLKVRNYRRQGKLLTDVTSNTADNTVFTKSSHGLLDGDTVELSGFTEATELNGISGATVQNKTTNTFELAGISSDPAETTGGTVFREDLTTAPGSDVVMTSGAGYEAQPYIHLLLHPKQFLSLPSLRLIVSNSNQTGTDAPISSAYGTEGTVDQTGITAIDDATDGTGFVETTDWFGGADTGGIVPGSISIIFYSAGYQNFGYTNRNWSGVRQTSSTSSGLTANTAYRFKCTIDGTANNIVFTTDTSDVTWGNGISGNGVLKKINDQFHAAWKAGTAAIKPKIHIVDGDIRVTSGSRLNNSAIALADSTTGSETQMFGTQGVPHEGSVSPAVAAALETATLLNRSYNNTNHILIDQGNGKGIRMDGGTFEMIGQTPYSPGSTTLRLTNCPPYANFSLYYNYNAALAGQTDGTAATQNIISDIYARCVNKKANEGIIRVFYAN